MYEEFNSFINSVLPKHEEEIIKILDKNFESFHNRKPLKVGRRYKRTPLDRFAENNELNGKTFISLYKSFTSREVYLPKAKRDYLYITLFQACAKVEKQRKDE